MITTKQRAYLRGLGNALDPVVQVGKEGLSENLITSVNLLLEAREIVKIKVLKNCDLTAKEVANSLSSATNSDVVQVIGAIIILYKNQLAKTLNILNCHNLKFLDYFYLKLNYKTSPLSLKLKMLLYLEIMAKMMRMVAEMQ